MVRRACQDFGCTLPQFLSRPIGPYIDNPCLSAQVSAFCASLPEYKAAERAYYAAEQDLEGATPL